MYVELHCHSNYSFQEGASFIHELLPRADELGYPALAITDHDNLCGAMEFARAARSLDVQPIIGAELTVQNGHHLTLLAEDRRGYSNLCRLLSIARLMTDRREPELDPRFLAEHTQGLVLLTGCRKGRVPSLAEQGRVEEAEKALGRYIEWFGRANVYVELQRNLVTGDDRRNRRLVDLASGLGIDVVATNNVHYHVRERHRLHDCLVSCQSWRQAGGQPYQFVNVLVNERRTRWQQRWFKMTRRVFFPVFQCLLLFCLWQVVVESQAR